MRDLIRMRSQVFAIILVVACGVAQLATNFTAFQALQNAQADYYRDYRFADVFASLKRAPDSTLRQIEAIPGILEVEPRLTHDLILDVPGLDQPASGRVISLPDDRQPALNQLYIRRGRYLEPGKPYEILISEAFADANKLQVGATINAVINGRWRSLSVVGVALSPEYIYQIKPGDLFPDNKRFGVLWMSRTSLAAVLDMNGAFNDVSIALERDASEPAVITELDRILRPYGGQGAYGRKNQVSHTFLSDEIRQNRVAGIVVPAIFLGLAGFLISTVLTRLVSIERDQIGLLKAFGFGNPPIAAHYLKMAILVITAGWLAGIVVGGWWALVLRDVYQNFYHFPALPFSLTLGTVAVTYLVVASTAAASAVGAVRRASSLPPAEAMRPPAPASFRSGAFELLDIGRWVPLTGRIVARNMARYPVRAVLSIFGIALGTAVLLVGHYLQDALHYVADLQFRVAQHDNESVTFRTPQNGSALYEIAGLPGVLRVEPVRAVPVRLRNGHRERRVALVGLPPDGELRRLVSQDGHQHRLPISGLVLTKKLADILHVTRGDQISVEAIEGRRPMPQDLQVTGLVDESFGISAYMNITEVNQFMSEGNVSSGALLLIDSQQQPQVFAALKRRPAIATVSSRTAALASFEETLAQTSGAFAYVLVLFATAIVFAAVYNAGRIALSERTRELASLCVLGFSRSEVAVVVIGEQMALTIAAIPIGLGIGYLIASWLSWVYTLEMFRIPVFIDCTSYFATVVSVAAAAALSAWVVRGRITRLQLVSAIKTME